jgi:hypothetical protein
MRPALIGSKLTLSFRSREACDSFVPRVQCKRCAELLAPPKLLPQVAQGRREAVLQQNVDIEVLLRSDMHRVQRLIPFLHFHLEKRAQPLRCGQIVRSNGGRELR